jgi:hypothetical protein
MPVSLQLISIEPQLPIPVYYLQKTSTFKITDTVNVSREGHLLGFCRLVVTKFAFQKLRSLHLICTFESLKKIVISN